MLTRRADYLKTTYSSNKLYFEEDGEVPDSATPYVHIPRRDYYARFEVAEHPNTATQFTASTILLELGGMVGLPAALAISRPPGVAPVNTAIVAPEKVKRPSVGSTKIPIATLVNTRIAGPDDNPLTSRAGIPTDTPTASAVAEATFAPRPHVPPDKFVRLAHRDVATSVVTFARAAMYKRVKEDGVVKRKLCVNYTRRTEVD